nr:DUF3304 domain-containing protein [Pseudomonas putida]
MLRHNSAVFFTKWTVHLVWAGIAYLLLVGTSKGAQAGILQGVNHTHWAINRFSVDGRSGLDTIGAWQLGGGGHFSLPLVWRPGLAVRVDWETGVSGTKGFPGFGDDEKYEAWASKLRAQKRQHSRLVHVPEYTAHSACGLTVHFLPCDEIQLTTSCYGYGHPEYPIKTPLKLPEPQSCPATEGASQ